MNINFRDRKHGRSFDSSYFLTEADRSVDVQWRIGDSVTILFPASAEQNAAMEKYRDEICDKDEFRLTPGIRGVSEFIAHIPCVVVDRHHSVHWKSVGNLEPLTSGAVLEAKDGQWEDLLAWIIVGKRPEWADAE